MFHDSGLDDLNVMDFIILEAMIWKTAKFGIVIMSR